MSSHPATRAYVARRSKEGLSKKEIIRCLKRYVAREVYPYPYLCARPADATRFPGRPDPLFGCRTRWPGIDLPAAPGPCRPADLVT